MRPQPANPDASERATRNSRLASIVLVAVLVGISVFAIWSSHVTSKAAAAADLAAQMSDHYDRADRAVVAEESLERKYRLEPGPKVREKFDTVAADLMQALDRVAASGDQDDRNRAAEVRLQHEDYLVSITKMYDAVDAGDLDLVLLLDETETEPLYDMIAETVNGAAATHHDDVVKRLAELRELESVTSFLTPWVFVTGLVLTAAMAWVTRGHRRLLDAERRVALHKSLHDSLTGLPNRTLLFERCQRALASAERSGQPAALLLIDLDRFKEVNDTFGHHYGDELLRQVGSRMRSVLAGDQTISRLGGDEFAVLLPEVTDVEEATAIGCRLRGVLEAPFTVEGVDLDVEASVGVVLSGEHGSEPTVLLQRADVAMYVAKTQNLGIFAYDPAVDGHSPDKLALLGDLRRAIVGDQLVLHYQPKVHLATGDIAGVEALIRWEHPVRGLIFPDSFIPLAEHTGLIGPLTRHVLDSALAQAKIWIDAGRPLIVSVNLSARSLLDDALPQQVAESLSMTGVPAELLELEITESALMAEPVRAQRLLELLAAMGVRLSIDDFGAGYTSLGQLKNLPVTEIKIDKSFILNMGLEPSDALIAHSIIDLGHNLGMTVLAEGVETAEALSHLTTFYCDIAQGFYLCRPVPAADFDRWRATYVPASGTRDAHTGAG